MKVTEVNVCDSCKKALAGRKCFLCGGDLCNRCGYNLELTLSDVSRTFFRNYFTYCNNDCRFKINKLYENGIITDVDKIIEAQIKSNLTAEALKDEKK